MKKNDKKNKKTPVKHSSSISWLKPIGKNITSWFKAKFPIIKFVGIFGSILTAYYLFMSSDYMVALKGYLVFLAHSAEKIMKIFTKNVHSQSSYLTFNSATIEISFGCDGLEPIVIFCAAVIAVPVKWKYKLMAIVIGSVLLFIFNFLRIIGLLLLQYYKPAFFNALHLEVFPIFFIVISISLFLLWQRYVIKKERVSNEVQN